jgi:hypothetical protein
MSLLAEKHVLLLQIHATGFSAAEKHSIQRKIQSEAWLYLVAESRSLHESKPAEASNWPKMGAPLLLES